jgi:hypothetical protein
MYPAELELDPIINAIVFIVMVTANAIVVGVVRFLAAGPTTNAAREGRAVGSGVTPVSRDLCLFQSLFSYFLSLSACFRTASPFIHPHSSSPSQFPIPQKTEYTFIPTQLLIIICCTCIAGSHHGLDLITPVPFLPRLEGPRSHPLIARSPHGS